MTPAEFKAWFTGYSEGIEKTPSEKQWKRICGRVAEIDGIATSHPVFIDRYWRWAAPVYPMYSSNISSCIASNAINTSSVGIGMIDTMDVAFDGFAALGQLDAKADA